MLKKLWIKGFRNIKELSLSLESGHHFFLYGLNNQGKTNFLEALFFLGNGKSPVENDLGNLVHFDESEALLGIDFIKQDVANRLYFKLTPEGKRQGFLNNQSLKSYSQLKRELMVEFISADVIRIFQDHADQRRQVLDRFCSGFYPDYGVLFRRYEKIIKQKNVLLKNAPSFAQIQFWNDQLVELAGQLIAFRQLALEEMTGCLRLLVEEVLPEFGGQVELSYEFKGFSEEITLDSYDSLLKKKLQESMDKEVHVGYSLYGPHRDDYGIQVVGRSLFSFYSRGINRCFAILFKLTEMILMDQKFQNFPVLLLDDVFAEVDLNLKTKLIKLLERRTRIFYSSTIREDAELFEHVKVYQVSNGQLSDA